MAEPYFERLVSIVGRFEWASDGVVTLEAKQFFSGAALYANGKICALFSPEGLALKVPADLRRQLITQGRGSAFRFFPEGPIKREYVAIPESGLQDEEALRELLGVGTSCAVTLEDFI